MVLFELIVPILYKTDSLICPLFCDLVDFKILKLHSDKKKSIQGFFQPFLQLLFVFLSGTTVWSLATETLTY